MCDAGSWLPHAVAETVRQDNSSAALLTWLHILRDTAEEYDPSVVMVECLPTLKTEEESETCSVSPDSAFDEILSYLGHEIFSLDEYRRHLTPKQEQPVSLSILSVFDDCLREIVDDNLCDRMNDSEVHVHVSNKEEKITETQGVQNDVTKPYVKTPVPLPRTRLKTPSSSSLYDADGVEVQSPRVSEADSASTNWSYKGCCVDENQNSHDYALLWSHSSGYHNSDEILKKVLVQNRATVSCVEFDSTSDFVMERYSVYTVGDRCDDGKQSSRSVVDMTPVGMVDDGYELVRDAITDENIYEEIEYNCNTDEGCSCGGSVEVESCSVSAASEGYGRDSPVYQNLRDPLAYAIPMDVIAWKNMLLDPYYNDDEEDEWITPEECAAYSREQRPPLVIPRITQYRGQRQERYSPPQTIIPQTYPEDNFQEPCLKESQGNNYKTLSSWSPASNRYDLDYSRKAQTDSPRFIKGLIQSRLVGSTENLSNRRPNYLNLPASSSGDSLDIEIREKKPTPRNRKSKSMVAKSPMPAPRVNAFLSTIEHQGPVKTTKYMENSKRVKKNWTDCYMVLTHTGIMFYKDHKTFIASQTQKPPGTPPSPTSGPWFSVMLHDAYVSDCVQAHTRRYTRSLLLIFEHNHYLIQDETEEGARKWYKLIKNVISKLSRTICEDITPQSQSSNTDLESIGLTPPLSSKQPHKAKNKAGGSSVEDLSGDDGVNKAHVKSRLRKLFAKRPSMDVLVNKGILKDGTVFGCNLSNVCPETSPRVPEFVVSCVKLIEENEENLCSDGLYRASGNLSQVQKIRLEVDQGNLKVLENYPDIHVLTGSLKLFFRELKEPLIPFNMFDRVLSACSIKPREARVGEFRDIVQNLPQCNRDTLKFLLEHLIRVTMYSEKNRMHTANLAIVFGPTLLWAPLAQAHNIAVDCIQQNNVVDILLNDFKEIFADQTTKTKA